MSSHGRLSSLDGVRCFAVLAVLALHLNWRYSGGGWIGVDTFFVLSGYLITTILLREHERTGRIDLRTFYVRRARRLYPALLVMLAAGVVAGCVSGAGMSPAGWGQAILQSVLYVEDFVVGITGSPHGPFEHTWSLAVEEQFYLAWPLVLIFVLRRRGSPLRWALGGTALSWLLLVAFSPRSGDPFYVPLTYFRPESRASSLLIGCALAAWLSRPRRVIPGLGVVSAATLVMIAFFANRYTRHTAMVPTIITADVASCALVYGLVTSPASWLSRALAARPLVWVGVRSYGFYLLAPVATGLLSHYLHTQRGPILTVTVVAVTLTACGASYRYIEQPFLRRRSERLETLREPLVEGVGTVRVGAGASL